MQFLRSILQLNNYYARVSANAADLSVVRHEESGSHNSRMVVLITPKFTTYIKIDQSNKDAGNGVTSSFRLTVN